MAQGTSSTVARAPERGQKHQRLKPLIGDWTIEGRNAPAAPVAGSTPVRGERHYEWLPGQFFVVGRWNHRADDGTSHEGAYIVGVENQDGTHVSHNYDNLGYSRDYRIDIADRKWTITGATERASVEFAADGNSFHETWQVLKDGVWAPLCELHGKRTDRR